MDYFAITAVTSAGLVFHAWLFTRIRRRADRDLALSLAGNDPNNVTGHCNGSQRPKTLA